MDREIENLVLHNEENEINQYIKSSNRLDMSPFVLLDAVHVKNKEKWGFGWHPHSGVSTFTFIISGALNHEDSEGNKGLIPENGFQWMSAGGAVWHKEMLIQKEKNDIKALQLWIQLPPSMEEGDVKYMNVMPEDIVSDGKTRVLIGRYNSLKSNTSNFLPININYFDVALKSGEHWDYSSGIKDAKAFLYLIEGEVSINGRNVKDRHFVQFKRGDGDLHVKSSNDSRFIFVEGESVDYGMVHEYGQIHTNRESLERSKERIKKTAPSDANLK